MRKYNGAYIFRGAFLVPALAVAPNKKRRNGVRRYITAGTKSSVRRYQEQRPPATQVIPN